jgi:hypothetical protein
MAALFRRHADVYSKAGISLDAVIQVGARAWVTHASVTAPSAVLGFVRLGSLASAPAPPAARGPA